jgi:hypothetical protein
MMVLPKVFLLFSMNLILSGQVFVPRQNSLIRPSGAPSPGGRRDIDQTLSRRERVAGGRVRE